MGRQWLSCQTLLPDRAEGSVPPLCAPCPGGVGGVSPAVLLQPLSLACLQLWMLEKNHPVAVLVPASEDATGTQNRSIPISQHEQINVFSEQTNHSSYAFLPKVRD